MERTPAFARPLGLAVLAAALALVAGACIPPPDPGPRRVDFDSDGALALAVNYGSLAEPDITVTEFELAATGSWLADDTGDFSADLVFADATLTAADGPLGAVSVVFSASQDGTASGNFDPDTGVGGFDTSVTLTLETIDSGSGPEPVEQPCDIEVSMAFTGSINLGNGWLTGQDADPVFTTMGPGDCGGLGAVLAPAIPGVDQHANVAFPVGRP